MKKKILEVFSLFLIVSSIFLIVFSMRVFTGFVISEIFGFNASIVGILVFLVGLVLFFLSSDAGLEGMARGSKKVSFYRDKDEHGDSEIYMRDPDGILSSTGVIGLRELSGLLSEFEDMRGEVSRLYANEIENIIGSPESIVPETNQDYADKFLRVIQGRDYKDEESYVNVEEEESVGLSPEERQKINCAFKIWDGTLTNSQRKMLKIYGLEYKTSKNHPVIYVKDKPSLKTPAPSSPGGNPKTGRAFAGNIISLIEDYREHRDSEETRT